VKKKHTQILGRQQSFYEAEARVSGRQLMKKQESFKSKMKAAELKLKSEQLKLEDELRSVDIDLSTTKDQLYVEKAKHRWAIQQQYDETQRAVSIVQNYADSLEDTNNDLRDELKKVLFEKHQATSLTAKAKQLASNRLEKWHIERERRRAAEDEVTRLNKSAMQMNQII
jgi:hypothetical protein